jgi:DHA1 family tetracycline resistance protein-like MFS transporter
MAETVEKKQSLFPIFFTVFIDLLGVGIVIPVLGHLFLDAGGILPADVSLFQRTMLLGLLIASYPIMQFFGSPILGALSDRHGRKNILIISLIGTLIGYILFAIGILTRNIFLIYLSRIIDGFTGGNISTAMSAIADISKPEEKARNFGLIGMAFGLGFIFGPFIGGVLADNTIVSWFSSSTPFWFAAILCFANIILVIFNFSETLKVKINTNISILTGFKNIRKALGMPNLRTMFLVIFLLTFGFNFFTQFFQVYLIEKFQYTQSQIGYLFAFMGLCIAITQGIITRQLSKKFTPVQVLAYSTFALSIAILLLIFPTKAYYLFFIMPLISVSNGLTYPNSTAIVSNLSAKDSQGEILGINQSIRALGMSIPPLISGFIAAVNTSLPIIVGSVTIFFAWVVFVFYFKPGEKKFFHEV